MRQALPSLPCRRGSRHFPADFRGTPKDTGSLVWQG